MQRERAYTRKRQTELRGQREQQIAHIGEIQKQISEASEQRQQLADTSELVAMERLSWATGTDEDVLKSRSRVSRALSEFITGIQVDFVQQTATVYVAGYARVFVFDAAGKLIAEMNGTAMPFGEIEKMMRLDNVAEMKIAQAKTAHAKIQSL